MFFPLILRLVELQRYGYKPMLSPQRDPSKGYLSDPCKPLHGFPTLPTSAFSAPPY